MNKVVILIGTFDTKGKEFQYIDNILNKSGIKTIKINAGVLGEPVGIITDYSNKDVANAVGADIEHLKKSNDRGLSMDTMTKGSAAIVKQLAEKYSIVGIISLGGSAGTTIGTSAMHTLPIGIPKIMVSTMASGDTRAYIGEKDIMMVNSIVDVSGINLISAKILGNAANAMVGMVQHEIILPEDHRPLIAASMFGVTTPCVTEAQEYMESKDYEVLVFHATGSGGMSMEGLIKDGLIAGVLDITTTELCDNLAGGVLSAGPHRLEAGIEAKIPQVISLGALDMVNFGPKDTVPEKYKNRLLYVHNPSVTLMRTTVDENIALGKEIATKLNKAKRAISLFIPLKGLSAIDIDGGIFYNRKADDTLFDTIRNTVNNPLVEIVEMDLHINDPKFAKAMADKLMNYIDNK